LIPFSAARPQPVFGNCRGKLVIVAEGEKFHGHQDRPIEPPGSGPPGDAE
jgi:hypothetical protein